MSIQRRHPSEEFPMEDWDAVLEVNLTAPFELCQLAGRASDYLNGAVIPVDGGYASK